MDFPYFFLGAGVFLASLGVLFVGFASVVLGDWLGQPGFENLGRHLCGIGITGILGSAAFTLLHVGLVLAGVT